MKVVLFQQLFFLSPQIQAADAEVRGSIPAAGIERAPIAQLPAPGRAQQVAHRGTFRRGQAAGGEDRGAEQEQVRCCLPVQGNTEGR